MEHGLIGHDDRSAGGQPVEAVTRRSGAGELLEADVEEEHRLVLRVLLAIELGEGRGDERSRIDRVGFHASSLDDEAPPSQHGRGLLGVPGPIEEERTRQAQPQRLQAPQPGILPGERGPAELDDVDLQPVPRQALEHRGEERSRFRLLVKGGVDEVDPEHSQGGPLLLDLMVAKRDVEEHVARLRAALRLEPEPDPAVLLVVALEVPCRDGVGEGEEAHLGPAGCPELRLQRPVLVLQHRQEPLPRDVAGAVAVPRRR